MNVLMKNEWISGGGVVFISLLISGAIIYSANRSGRVPLAHWTSLGKAFLGLAVIIAMTFWYAPEVLVYVTANDIANNAAEFTITHPGPKTGKHSHCQAGIQYYDDYLHREIELCTDDKDVNIDAKYIYVQRKVSLYGANIQCVSFVHAIEDQ